MTGADYLTSHGWTTNHKFGITYWYDSLFRSGPKSTEDAMDIQKQRDECPHEQCFTINRSNGVKQRHCERCGTQVL